MQLCFHFKVTQSYLNRQPGLFTVVELFVYMIKLLSTAGTRIPLCQISPCCHGCIRKHVNQSVLNTNVNTVHEVFSQHKKAMYNVTEVHLQNSVKSQIHLRNDSERTIIISEPEVANMILEAE